MTLDYLAHLHADSARFAAVLRDAPAGQQVPTCPDWQTDDLLWHLAEVQWFWGTIVHDNVTDPEAIDHPDRPTDRAGLLAFFDEATTLLHTALAETDPAEHRWTWSDDQTAGFIRRRQAHEALIHRLDAELTADVARAPVDASLADDGIDEALRVMFGGCPPWAKLRLDPDATLQVRSTDTDRSWLVTIGAFSGTSPSGNTYTDELTVDVADPSPGTPAAASGTPAAVSGTPAAATVEGTAADLDCWLWGRPTVGTLHRTGDEAVHARFQEVVSAGIE